MKDDWKLMLVNPWKKMEAGYVPELADIGNQQSIDKRALEDLREMLLACEKAGLKPLICSSYRNVEKQEALHKNKIARLIDGGMEKEEAAVEAAKVVAFPGTSEHQLGLALDIVDTNYQSLEEDQEKTEVQQWLMKHSWTYGFILRFPKGKTKITGIIYEPWHYRYVGKEHGKKIYGSGLTLEEYVESL